MAFFVNLTFMLNWSDLELDNGWYELLIEGLAVMIHVGFHKTPCGSSDSGAAAGVSASALTLQRAWFLSCRRSSSSRARIRSWAAAIRSCNPCSLFNVAKSFCCLLFKLGGLGVDGFGAFIISGFPRRRTNGLFKRFRQVGVALVEIGQVI